MAIVGLDLSINSTGVCVRNNNECKFYIIANKVSKKSLSFQTEKFNYLLYNKKIVNSSDNYIVKEIKKTENLYNILNEIKTIIKSVENVERVCIEGMSYGSGSTTSILELAGLNYMVRNWLMDQGIPFYIISPTGNKKSAVGLGSANKDILICTFLKLFPEYKPLIMNNIKIDDIVDAYFLSMYEIE